MRVPDHTNQVMVLKLPVSDLSKLNRVFLLKSSVLITAVCINHMFPFTRINIVVSDFYRTEEYWKTIRLYKQIVTTIIAFK